MTTTQATTRVEIRMMGMSTEDLRSLVENAGAFDYSAIEEARTARFVELATAELAQRHAAGGR